MTTHTCESKTTSLSPSFHECLQQRRCEHRQVIGKVCRYCCYDVGDSYGIQFEYVHPGLRLSYEEAARRRSVSTQNMLTQRKLHLILDIDHTLLHTVQFDNLKPIEIDYLKKNAKTLKDSITVFKHEFFTLLVKLRPFVHTFLKEASSLFEMYLYTRGTRLYAKDIAWLLDPQCSYFGKRIITRDETPRNFKTLELVIAQNHAILIVDDTRDIWAPHDQKNLIPIDKYCYFAMNDNGGYFMSETDESETNGGLARMLGVLRELHGRFFEQNDVTIDNRDIRSLIESIYHSI